MIAIESMNKGHQKRNERMWFKTKCRKSSKNTLHQKKTSEIRDKLPKNIESKFAVLQHAMKQGQRDLAKGEIGDNKENVYVNRKLRQISVLKKQNRKNEAEKLVLELLEIYGSIANISLACGEAPRIISRIFSTDSKPVVDDLYTRKLKYQDKKESWNFTKRRAFQNLCHMRNMLISNFSANP